MFGLNDIMAYGLNRAVQWPSCFLMEVIYPVSSIMEGENSGVPCVYKKWERIRQSATLLIAFFNGVVLKASS